MLCNLTANGRWLLPLLISLLALLGCQSQPPATPSAALPTLQPTVPAGQVEMVAGAAEGLEETPQSGTPVATTRATPTPAGPTPTFAPTELNLTQPDNGAEFIQGSLISASGSAVLNPGQRLEVSLISANGRLLAGDITDASQLNRWQTPLIPPNTYAGTAYVRAAIFAADDTLVAEDFSQIELTVDTSAERYLELFRPLPGSRGVSGYNFFFDGYAQRPVNFVVSIALLDANCRETLARESYTLRGSGYWQGFIVIPNDVSGPLCALAYAGDADSPDRRETMRIIDILPADDPDAYQVMIGNPPPGTRATAGSSILLYGTASRAPRGEVEVGLLTADGRLVAGQKADVNRFGYWETRLTFPVDLTGEMLLFARIGTPGDIRAEDSMLIGVDE